MRALIVLLLCTGCTDYNKLSAGKVDGGDSSDMVQTPGADMAEAPAVNPDLAGADLAGDDLAGTDFAQAPTTPADMTVLPSTCKEINDATLAANDGNYVLYFNRDVTKQWVVYCKGMGPGGTPIEYLTLPQGVAGNYSVIGADLGAYSQFTKIRLDPTTLKVDLNDAAYNTAAGNDAFGCTFKNYGSDVPYAYAYAYCGTTNGIGMVDLQGTPFSVPTNAFKIIGTATAVFSNSNQTVTLTATGPGSSVWIVSTGLFLVLP